MVLDMKKVELKKAIHDGALWVVEQIPGYVSQDLKIYWLCGIQLNCMPILYHIFAIDI